MNGIRHLIAAVFLGAASLVVWCEPSFAGRRVALVVGNSTYENVVPLLNPRNDARAIAAMFRKAGFDVVSEHHDKKIVDFRRVIREFVEVAANADVAVVYFAGHGIEIRGTNYVLPTDAKLATDLDADDEAITLDRLVRSVEGARGLRLVILDACRDNPFLRTMRRQRTAATRTIANHRGMAEPTDWNGDTLIFYAAKAGSVAKDGDGEHSPFTAALMSHLFVPGRDIRRAFGWVRDDVLKATGNVQEPYYYGSLGAGDIALVPAPAPSDSADTDLAEAMNDYRLVERVATAGAYEAFLTKHPTGLYANLARERLAKLQKPLAPQAPEGPTLAAVAPDTRAAPANSVDDRAGRDSAVPEMREAALPRTDVKDGAAANTPAGPSMSDRVRLAQTELVRIGCYTGTVDGNFNDATKAAIKQYQLRRGEKSAAIEVTDALIAGLKARTARVCPLVCPPGKTAQGDQCIVVRKQPAVARQTNDSQETAKRRASPAQSPVRAQSPARQESGSSRSRPSAPAEIFIGGGGVGVGAGF